MKSFLEYYDTSLLDKESGAYPYWLLKGLWADPFIAPKVLSPSLLGFTKLIVGVLCLSTYLDFEYEMLSYDLLIAFSVFYFLSSLFLIRSSVLAITSNSSDISMFYVLRTFKCLSFSMIYFFRNICSVSFYSKSFFISNFFVSKSLIFEFNPSISERYRSRVS
mgnify:CR=1 FL=1